MIAIFSVLGLVLFGGGAYAIIDGWPYLVLERGFTQVIIGSIASTAGLILLSLAWVLKEVRGLREAFYDAIEARAETRSAAPAPVAADVRVAPEVRMPPTSMPASMPGLVPAAVSAAAAGAVANALSAPTAEESQAAPKPAAAADIDLFGDLVARRLRDSAPESDEEAVAETPAAETPPLPDMFESMLADQLAAPQEANEPPVAVATESHEPAEIVSAKVQPISEDEALAHSDELAHDYVLHGDRPAAAPEPVDVNEEVPAEDEDPAPEPEDHRSDAVEAALDAPADEEPAKAAPSSSLDEFSALRESLTGHLRQSSREDERIEPALEPEADPFAVAESWMDRASPRREPWFDAPPPVNESEPPPAEPAASLWPPRTETPDFEETPQVHEPEAAASLEGAPAFDAEEPAAEPDKSEPDVEPTEDQAEAETEETAAAPEPAASEEGVVGAYQVGDAHFTIYADGSIRARTPDGEYSFASMDELKVYLASEKSRLGA